MDVKVESIATSGSEQARNVRVIGLVEVLFIVGLVVAAVLLLPKIRSVSQPAAVLDFQTVNPEVRQAQRYLAAEDLSSTMVRGSAALNPELAAAQRFTVNAARVSSRWQAANPELRSVERYRQAQVGPEPQQSLSANPELQLFRNYTAVHNQGAHSE